MGQPVFHREERELEKGERDTARAEAQESYYSGLTSAEDYESAAAQAGEVLAHERGFDAAFQQYLYVSENPSSLSRHQA